MAREIRQPGPGQLRALFVSAGNPAMSVPEGGELESALEELELSVSLDIYVNETNKHCDYVLPATTWLEREDVPVALLQFYTQPFVQYTPATVAAYGEARPEWQVIDELCERMGGLVTLESTLGEGTTFTVRLPGPPPARRRAGDTLRAHGAP